MVIFSLKYLLTSGTKASSSSTERQTFSDRTQLIMSDVLTFDLMGATYLNWGVGSAGVGVLGRGLTEGAWTFGAELVFSAEGASIRQIGLFAAKVRRSVDF